MSKILILTGSPREMGNTMALADAFTKAVEENGHSVDVYQTDGIAQVSALAERF